ncbi:hypothetical protein ON010_g9712 [Phytophthora cinnamomi]|nr:hypothetical protein ON010_g9712 [Phytophthora cinnamomi]
MAFGEDMARGGKRFMELAEIHLWDRILTANCDVDTALSFHDRVVKLHLKKLGKTREDYLHFLKSEFNHQTPIVQAQWKLPRWISAFELLCLSMTPFVYTAHQWVLLATGENDQGLATFACSASLGRLRLLRSAIGCMLLSVLNDQLHDNEVLSAINVLARSDLSADEMPVLSKEILTLSTVENTTISHQQAAGIET